MGTDSSQSVQPGAEPGEGQETMPQQSAAAAAGPDSVKLPPSPLSKGSQDSKGQEVDWEARYKGLDRRYQQERQQFEAQLKAQEQLTKGFEKLEKRLLQLEEQVVPRTTFLTFSMTALCRLRMTATR